MSKRIILNLGEAISPQLGEAVEVTGKGGLIIYPTDTFYGLGANPLDVEAVRRIFTIKRRLPDKPILVLISEKSTARTCTLVDVPYFELLAGAFWPGPLTIILPALSHMPADLIAGGDKLGLRLPGSEVAREIVSQCGRMLTGTTANLSGMADASRIEMIDDSVVNAVDLVIDAGTTPGRTASTIIDLTGTKPVILRQGAISQEDLEQELKIGLT